MSAVSNQRNATLERIRKKFVLIVYALAVVMITFTLVQWCCLILLVPDLSAALPVPKLVWLVPIFMAMSVLNWCPRSRYDFPITWLLVFIIIECTTLAMADFVQKMTDWDVVLMLLFATLILANLHVYGIFAPEIVQPGHLTAIIASVLALVVGTVLISVFLVTEEEVYLYPFFIVMIILVIIMGPYHVQFIYGRMVPVRGKVVCAMSLYLDLIVLSLACAFIKQFKARDE